MFRLLYLLLLVLLLSTAGAQGRLNAPNYYLSQLPELVDGEALRGELTTEDGQNFKDGSYLDLYALRGEAGQTVRIAAVSLEFDTFLTVYGPDGSLLDWVDDNPYSIDAELTLELPETGRYLVVVSGYSSHDLGRYTVSMTTHDPAVTPSATEIDVPGVFAGVLDGDGPMVPYMEVPGGAHVFELTEPAALAIYAASDAFDTYVLVTDAEGSLVVENDDRNYSEASGYDTSSLAFAEFEPGVYYVYVTSWYSQPIGEYDLEIRRFVYAD
ncbi:MAG: hypothetical protein GX560_11205 [Deinococcales bacterium]|nr:hypothetical protein [Deinococcales bacterium]